MNGEGSHYMRALEPIAPGDETIEKSYAGGFVKDNENRSERKVATSPLGTV